MSDEMVSITFEVPVDAVREYQRVGVVHAHSFSLAALAAVKEAVLSEPIKVGDRVRWRSWQAEWTVRCLLDGMAWLWDDDGGMVSAPPSSLIRCEDQP